MNNNENSHISYSSSLESKTYYDDFNVKSNSKDFYIKDRKREDMQNRFFNLNREHEKLTKNKRNDIIFSDFNNEGKIMSITGFIKCKDGILGFADKKCTLQTIEGYYEEDETRGKIIKIFENSKIIVTTSGNNIIGKTNIEDLLSLILRLECNKIEFIKKIEEVLFDNLDNRNFDFLLFDKESKRIFNLNFVNFKLNKVSFDDDYFLQGNNTYIYFIKKYYSVLNKNDLTIDDAITYIVNLACTASHEALKLHQNYDPVSKEIDFIKYYFE